MMSEPWPLTWISEEKLVSIADRAFRNSLKKLKDPGFSEQDPTLVAAMGMFRNLTGAEIEEHLTSYKVIKSFQNAIGSFHQEILGSVDGWESLGGNGGVFDIQSLNPVELAGDRFVVAEVKMRFNTIKASDEKGTWDKLADAVKSRGGRKKYVGYLIQIIPQSAASYDKEWKVSNRNALDYVRCIDGRSAYHLVTGDPNAIVDLFLVLDRVFEAVASKYDWLEPSLPPETFAQAVKKAIEGSIAPVSALQSSEEDS